MQQLPQVDAVLTDPPYNSKLNYNSYQDDLPKEVYWAWMRAVVLACCTVAKNLVAIKHSSMKVIEWGKEIGSGRLVIWYKPFSSGYPVNGFAMHYEPIWICKGKSCEWSKDVIVQNAGALDTYTGHPAQMPEKLVEKMLELCAGFDGDILDPFMGSGTTSVACVNKGRKFVGIEIDEHYWEIAVGRTQRALMDKGLMYKPLMDAGHVPAPLIRGS